MDKRVYDAKALAIYYFMLVIGIGIILLLFYLLTIYPNIKLILVGITIVTVLILFCGYKAIDETILLAKGKKAIELEGIVKSSYEENGQCYIVVEYNYNNVDKEIALHIGKQYYDILYKENTPIPLKIINDKPILDIKKIFLPKFKK